LRESLTFESRSSENASRFLRAPTPDSRSPEHEGRRLKKVQGGWIILNRRKYRGNSLYGKRATADTNGSLPNGTHTPGSESGQREESKESNRVKEKDRVKGKDQSQSQSSISNTKYHQSFSPIESDTYERLPTELHRKAFLLFREWAEYSVGKGEPDFPLSQLEATKELSCSQSSVSGIVSFFQDHGIIEQTAAYKIHKTPARYRWALETTLPIPAIMAGEEEDECPF
jgi:hypothetical protein